MLAVCGANGSLSALHIRAVTHHKNAHKRVAVGVPPNNGLILLILVATADSLVLERNSPPLFLDLFFGLHRVVDVSNLVVAHRHQIDTSNLGNDAERVGVGPCRICEGSISEKC